jgi:hypothetical protein
MAKTKNSGLSAAARKALKKIGAFDAPEIEGEYLGGAGGAFNAPGAYATRKWSIGEPEIQTIGDKIIGVRVPIECKGLAGLRLELSTDSSNAAPFEINWKITKGIISVAAMDEDLREAAIEACTNPGKKGNLETVIDALDSIDSCIIEVAYQIRDHGWPSYRGLKADTNVEEYQAVSLTLEEAAKARADKKAAKGGVKKKNQSRNYVEESDDDDVAE